MLELIPHVDSTKYNKLMTKVHEFFKEKGFTETYTQNRLSILAACEDPKTIQTFHYNKQLYPLPQTSQLWLEHILLKEPKHKGLYTISTSYRNEPNPIPGRHNISFGMLEWELHGGIEVLQKFEHEFLMYLGFQEPTVRIKYEDACKQYGVSILENEHEERMYRELSHVVYLTHFPTRANSFWNMKINETNPGVSNKIDVIICGQETIGSAERSCNKEEMRKSFYTISNGEYAGILFKHFGRDRVEAELDEFLSLDFFQRSGGGIGITRLLRGMELCGLL